MNKTYIAPNTEVYKLKVESLLTTVSNTEAGEGSKESPVNFSREGRGFGDDE